jgi:hypothetical protein
MSSPPERRRRTRQSEEEDQEIDHVTSSLTILILEASWEE